MAAFPGRRGRLDLLKRVWLDVGIAVALCLVVGVALKIVSTELRQRQQEGLETIVSFTDGTDPTTGQLDAGLFFICFNVTRTGSSSDPAPARPERRDERIRQTHRRRDLRRPVRRARVGDWFGKNVFE